MGEINIDLLITYQWEIFITLELLSLVSLLLFGVVRYVLNQKKRSRLLIIAFLMLLILEALLAFLIYKKTGEVSTFQVVIVVFLLYAGTFGIADFRKLDRWMRQKIGKWRGVDLLTEKDHRLIARHNNPKYIAKKHRWSASIHLLIFVIVQWIFWSYGTADAGEMLEYTKDWSWVESGNYEDSPYPNEAIYSIGMIWSIVFVIDFIYSWSYTFFPTNKKE